MAGKPAIPGGKPAAAAIGGGGGGKPPVPSAPKFQAPASSKPGTVGPPPKAPTGQLDLAAA